MSQWLAGHNGQNIMNVYVQPPQTTGCFGVEYRLRVRNPACWQASISKHNLYPLIQIIKAAPLLQKDGFSPAKMKGETKMGKHRLNKYERETILLTSEGDDTWGYLYFQYRS